MLKRTLAVAFGFWITFGSMVSATEIVTWGTAQGITGDTDVSTSGSLVYAYNFGATGVANTTVNGVQFSAWAVPDDGFTATSTIGSINLDENSGSLLSFNTLGTGSGAFAGLSSVYQGMLSTGGGATVGGTLSLTMGGLTAGNTYQFQWWFNNSALVEDTFNHRTFLLTTSTAGNSVTLDSNVGDISGNLGQYALGSFVATGTSSVIAFDGAGTASNMPLMNAFQLRDITPVPEPSTYIFATIAACTLGYLARRRGKQSERA